jgi:transposase
MKRYSEEFKRDAIALVDSTGRTSPRWPEPGVSPEALRSRYKQARTDRGEGRPGEHAEQALADDPAGPAAAATSH